ncbi:OTU domain-containing protein 3-like isoform X2 [Ornithodoros turicata]|uniref:OTU domain-containing protein 3-like isoform X2 n=1 Tax=Ornithodoros turicata TaxID=34597 RepID=UPI00313925A3
MARRKSNEKYNCHKANNAKMRYKANSDDENFSSFKDQLLSIGLTLRVMQGDGALNDQMEGHTRSHLKYRSDTVQYMKDHRCDFEPFVEDDVPFAQHLHNLAQPGTYAGNDAIVAFARLHQVVIVIHQLNTPLWQVRGTDKPNSTELHLSYHNGDHYNSVRKIGDNSQGPASIRLSVPKPGTPQIPNEESNAVANLEAQRKLEEGIMLETGTEDLQLVREVLQDCGYDRQSAVDHILSHKLTFESDGEDSGEIMNSIWSIDGTGTRIFGEAAAESATSNSTATTTKGPSPRKRVSARTKKEQKKQERKQRNEQRKREEASTSPQENANKNDTAVIVTDLKCLSI